MEDQVKDAILFPGLNDPDPVLITLINLTVNSIRTRRHLFDNPLHEPVLYKKFQRWVEEAKEEQNRLNDAENEHKKELGIG